MKRGTFRLIEIAWDACRLAGIAALTCALSLEQARAQQILTVGSALVNGSAFGPNGIALGSVEQSCSDPSCTVSVPLAPRFGTAFSGFAFADISPSALSISGRNTFGGDPNNPLESVDYSAGGNEAFYAHVAADAELTIVLTTHFSSTAAGASVGLHDVFLGSERTANAFAFGDFQARYTLRVGSAINGPGGLPYYWVDTIKASAGVGLSGSSGLAQDGTFDALVTVGVFDSAGNQLNVVSSIPEPTSMVLLLSGFLFFVPLLRRPSRHDFRR